METEISLKKRPVTPFPQDNPVHSRRKFQKRTEKRRKKRHFLLTLELAAGRKDNIRYHGRLSCPGGAVLRCFVLIVALFIMSLGIALSRKAT